MKCMDTYKRILQDKDLDFPNSKPFKVGLDEFFGFNAYTKDDIQEYPYLIGITSWFSICEYGIDHVKKVLNKRKKARGI